MFSVERENQNPLRLADSYARIYRDLGDRYLAEGEVKSALRHFDKAVRFDPNCTEAYFGRALCLLEIGNCEEALADLSAAIRLSQTCTKAFRLRALIHLSRAEFNSAVSDLTQAIHLDPGRAASFRTRGAAHFANGAFEKAIADFTAALRLAPEDVDAYCYRALARLQIGDCERALSDAEAATALDPADQDARLVRDAARHAGLQQARAGEPPNIVSSRNATATDGWRAQVRRTVGVLKASADRKKLPSETSAGIASLGCCCDPSTHAQPRAVSSGQHNCGTDLAVAKDSQFKKHGARKVHSHDDHGKG